MQIESVNPPEPGRRFKAALFDFDGTLSLIREGWQGVMIPYFCEELNAAPGFVSEEDSVAVVTEFVDRLTGKQTIFQCIALADEITCRGGKPKGPAAYKAEYLRRLMRKIDGRRKGLADGTVDRGSLIVKGGAPFVRALKNAGLEVYCASGTDQPQVREEAALLGFDALFGENIFGARDEDASACAKEAVIRRLLTERKIGPAELLSFGDGFVEIELVASIGGYAVGVATDEKHGGIDEGKRLRLLNAGARAIIADFSDTDRLLNYLGIHKKGEKP
ncbi:MAG: HAD family hydrolase [Clostridia bacterium]|nr:HAD family hydrolase [Clostridia bacterium]